MKRKEYIKRLEELYKIAKSTQDVRTAMEVLQQIAFLSAKKEK